MLKPLLFTVASLCMMTPWLPTSAQSSSDSGQIGFADAAICKPDIIDVPAALRNGESGKVEELPTNIEADNMSIDQDTRLLLLTGNAQVVQGKRGVYADQITYNEEDYTATAEGNVRFYTSGGDEIKAESLEIEVDTFIGEANAVSMKIADNSPLYTTRKHSQFREDYSIFAPIRNRLDVLDSEESEEDDTTYVKARATADKVSFEGTGYERLTNAVMSTCPEGDDDVLLMAKEVELDHAEGIGRAKSMKVKFKGVPIFYFPSASFPINDQRKTGFLFPSISYEKDSGVIVQAPYYINIAPNRDATIIPRILSHRGAQIYGEFRYLGENSEGAVRAEVLPSDRVYNDEDRYAIGLDHKQDFTDDLRLNIDLQSVSDSDYLRDFSNEVDIVASSYVPQRATLTYNNKHVRFSTRLSTYETVNDDISISNRPYETLPRITFNVKPKEFGALEAGINSEYTNFERDDDARISGSRVRVKPYISLPLERIYGHFKPKISLQTISYSLDNVAEGADESPSVSVPIASIDSGLIFERLFKRGDKNYLQTLEPRLFYVKIPDEIEQEAFPNFDTGSGSISSFGHFFREDRFFGGDRVGDTHQVSVGLISRVFDDDSGAQKFSVKLGQVFFLDDREVGLTEDSAPETEDRSDFLLEATANINEDWKVRSFSRWSEEEGDLEYTQLSAYYDHSDRRNASVSYTMNKDSDEQLNLALETPLSPRLQMESQVNYSMEDSELRSAGLGVTYDGCCWAIKFGAKRYLDGNGQYDNRFIFTFELDDLGRISSQL